MNYHVDVEHVRIDHPEVELSGFEVVVCSEQADYTFDVYVDEATANAVAARLRDMLEVVG